MALEAVAAELQPIAVSKCSFDLCSSRASNQSVRLAVRRQRCGSYLSTRYEKAPPVRLHGQSGKPRERQGLSTKDRKFLATASFNGHHPVCCLIPPLIDSRDRIRVVLLQRLIEADDLRS